VLADSDSEEERGGQRQRQLRRTRQVSPEQKMGRRRARQDEELDIVNRKPNGDYLMDVSASNEMWLPQLEAEDMVEEQRAKSRLS